MAQGQFTTADLDQSPQMWPSHVSTQRGEFTAADIDQAGRASESTWQRGQRIGEFLNSQLENRGIPAVTPESAALALSFAGGGAAMGGRFGPNRNLTPTPEPGPRAYDPAAARAQRVAQDAAAVPVEAPSRAYNPAAARAANVPELVPSHIPIRDVMTPGEWNRYQAVGQRAQAPLNVLPSENRGLALPGATPAEVPVEPFPQGPSTVPRVLSGESVIADALTHLDEASLNRIARARKISTSNLPRGNANTIQAIVDSMTPDELEEARSIGIEVGRMGHPVPDLSTEAGRELSHVRIIQQFFPETRLPKAMLSRAQKTQTVSLSDLLGAVTP